MITNYMFFDIDLPCFSRKLIRVNDPRVAYVTIGTENKIKNFEAQTSGLREFRKKGERERAQPQHSTDLKRRRNAVNRKTVRDGRLQ